MVMVAGMASFLMMGIPTALFRVNSRRAPERDRSGSQMIAAERGYPKTMMNVGQRLALARIKLRAEQQIERMHRERQIGERLHCIIVEAAGLETSPGPVEALAQRSMFFGVSRLPEQTKHLVGTNPRLTNGLHRGIDFDLAGNDRREQQALKLATSRGTIFVDAATVVLTQRGARLWSFRDYAVASSHRTDGKAELLERVCVIAGLKLDVPEEDAVAAHAAGQAQTGSGSCGGHRNLRSLRIAKISRAYLAAYPEAIAVQPLGLHERRHEDYEQQTTLCHSSPSSPR
jgi:hypothetical protein